MATNKPQRNLRIDDELFLKIRAISDDNSRSFNKQVEFILKQFVKDYETQNGSITVNTDELYE